MAKKKKKLTNKQAKFVKEYVVNDKGAAGSIVAAGYNVTHPKSATMMGNALLKTPKIQSEIQLELDKLYPDSRANRFKVLHEILEDENLQPGVRIKAIETVNKMVGDNSPTTHLRAELTGKIPLLPGGGE